jgi:CubicO group peptidase (beta-lactamase class C family)
MKTKALKTAYIVLIISIFSISAKSQSVSDLLDGYYAYNRFWGSVLVVQNDKVLFQKSYGYADKDNNIKNDANTIFDLGSVTKTMTAVAVLTLHDQGKLSVYDRVDKYIPGFINDNTENVTIINLLNHTSGMAANLGRIDEEGKGLVLPTNEPVSLQVLVEKFKTSKLKYQPGKRYEYNNYGYSLLAYIIEKVSGMSYADYVNQAILSKANMTNTFYKLNLAKRTAIGYSGVGTNDISPAKDGFHPSWIIGAGYMFSTTNDLARYMQTVFSHQLFSENTMNLMMDTIFTTRKGGKYWALGWAKQKIEGLDCYAHSGGVFGYSSRIAYLPEKNIYIIVLSNLVKDINFDEIYSARFSFVDEIVENIIKIESNKTVAYLPVPKGKADKKLAGKYKFDNLHHADLSIRNDTLVLSTDPKGSFTLFDYCYNKEIVDTGINYPVCREFAQSILAANFEGFEKNVSDEMKKGLFNPEGIKQINGVWKSYASQSGSFLSYTICNRSDNNYTIAFHYEKAEIIMQLSFNSNNLVQGLFFLNVLPKCEVHSVSLVPVGNNEYVVDGYKYGGYNDYRVKFDKSNLIMRFSNDSENFNCSKIN